MNAFLRTLCLLLLVLLAASGCKPGAEEQKDTAVAPAPVDTLVLAATTFVDTFDVVGTAEPLQTVHLSSDVPGRILSAAFEEGDFVRRGQTVFRIDLEVDAAGLDVLRTQVSAAERELQRIERLRAEGLATAQQLDSATTELDNARQNLRQRELSVSRNTVSSPIAGFLSTRFADPGEFANAGAPLAEVIDYDTIVVYAQVPESEIRHVQREETIDVHIPALEETFEGTIHRVALRANDTSRTFRVEIRVDNEDHRIRPGMRARLSFQRRQFDDVVMIPRDAVLEGFRAREAMVVTDVDGELRAQVRTVILGPGSTRDVVVTDGLNAGDRLILRGHRGLIENALVEVISEATQSEEL